MEKFWDILNLIMDILERAIVVLLFATLTFSVGYQLGFKIGLDTKVTWVGEKYIMKLTGKGNKR
jgi:hypothetical protein